MIKIRINRGSMAAFIQVHAPCNDSYSKEEKDESFSNLADKIKAVPDSAVLTVMVDLNGHVDLGPTPWQHYRGPRYDTLTEYNYNGEQALVPSAEFSLLTTSTLYQRRCSQKDPVQINGMI